MLLSYNLIDPVVNQPCGMKNDIVRMSIDKVNDNYKHVGNSNVVFEYLLHVAIDQGLWWLGNLRHEIHVR